MLIIPKLPNILKSRKKCKISHKIKEHRKESINSMDRTVFDGLNACILIDSMVFCIFGKFGKFSLFRNFVMLAVDSDEELVNSVKNEMIIIIINYYYHYYHHYYADYS